MRVQQNQSHLETLAGDGERGPHIAAVKHGDGILVAYERDDRVLAAVQRHLVELHEQLIFIASGWRLDAVGMGAYGKALEIVSRAMNPHDGVDRLGSDL